MGRLIDADVFKAQGAAETVKQGLNMDKMALFFALIDMQPTVDAEVVRHGYWVQWHEQRMRNASLVFVDGLRCSECGKDGDGCEYCSRCGARMDKEVSHD